MTLVDAGPLTALIDRNEPRHRECVAALQVVSVPLLTTWPAFTEAMYLLGQVAGWPGQERLWQLLFRGELTIPPLDDRMCQRARDLMAKYRDLPMDLADATLVALAEARNIRRVFTLDSDFRIYRFRGRTPFDLIP